MRFNFSAWFFYFFPEKLSGSPEGCQIIIDSIDVIGKRVASGLSMVSSIDGLEISR